MPLNIFEARYRVLFNTLLYTPGAEDLEEGLVQTESPFAGTRQFGMCWTDSKGAIAAIGTTLEIKSHVLLEDGRMGIETIGRERFRILSVKQEKPVLVCEIELLDEDDDSSTQLIQQADEVRELFRALIQLHTKRGKVKPEDAEQYEPEELRQLGPRNLSFWIASNFRETPQQQQILLQENSTAQRLEYEKKVLDGSVNYLRAKLAVEGALAPDAAGNPEEQPPNSD
ncbi:g12504 [Coccomyxa viridis]|uniref:G12504 protein n=1 Tax=Coccomyxa viridis TaxID=1274662 RepID=A0ABP1GAI0_9CHLO